MATWLRIAIAILIVIHGYLYVPFAFYLVNDFQRSKGGSRLLAGVLGAATLRTGTLAVHVAAGALLLACGLLLALAPGATPVWRSLAVAGGAAGVLAFMVAWNGRSSHFSEQGVLGATASLAVLIGALAFADAVG